MQLSLKLNQQHKMFLKQQLLQRLNQSQKPHCGLNIHQNKQNLISIIQEQIYQNKERHDIHYILQIAKLYIQLLLQRQNLKNKLHIVYQVQFSLIHPIFELSFLINTLWVSLALKKHFFVFDTPAGDTHTFYFLGVRKYPLFFTMVPSSLVPLYHPRRSMSCGGTTRVYLYIDLPLYSRALCFCNIITLRMQKLLYNCGATKFIYSCCILYMATYMKEKIDIKRMINDRKARGMIFLEEGFEPKEVNKSTWIVPSQSGNGTYTVRYFKTTNSRWLCDCPDFEHRGIKCKHINAVKIWKNLKGKFEQINLKVKQNIKVDCEIEVSCCKFCNSTDFIKYGKKNDKQIYMCKSCGRCFVDNVDFENMKYNPKIVALTLDLYFRGLSLRKISSHLKEFYNLSITHMTIYNWIEKYVSIMNEYVNSITPDIGNVWHTDEMMVNIGGSWEYLWNVIDEHTRFQLCSVVSTERKVRDARMVFQKAKKNCGGRKPKYIVTDGLMSYHPAINKEFKTTHGETEHLGKVGITHHPNNNHVERLHGTVREREKTMRGMKVKDTPIVEGHRLYYNFIRPHEALDGKTPSEEAGITIEGSNKWLALMRTAIKYNKCKKETI